MKTVKKFIPIIIAAALVAAGYVFLKPDPAIAPTPTAYPSVSISQQPGMTTVSPSPVKSDGCKRGGCSGQLCIEEGEDGVSTCEWREEYGCYQKAECKRQASGQCGFTQTTELIACLEDAAKNNPPPPPVN